MWCLSNLPPLPSLSSRAINQTIPTIKKQALLRARTLAFIIITTYQLAYVFGGDVREGALFLRPSNSGEELFAEANFEISDRHETNSNFQGFESSPDFLSEIERKM